MPPPRWHDCWAWFGPNDARMKLGLSCRGARMDFDLGDFLHSGTRSRPNGARMELGHSGSLVRSFLMRGSLVGFLEAPV
jgi:hypothetical protein